MRRHLRQRGKLALGIVGLAAAAAVIWFVPKSQVSALPLEQRFGAENEARRTLAQVLGGLALLGGLWLTLRQVKASERTAASAVDGQVTERFSRAVEHLGSDQLPLRLGGIYALERIARDSERDHSTVLEVLIAFIRDAAPAGDCHRERYSANEAPTPPRPDVQAALTVVGRRKTENDSGRTLDLSRTDLRGADFRGLDFRKARFYLACLQAASFRGAQVREADFSAASLYGVIFTDAQLDGANLITALTGGTCCRGASLRGTMVSEDNIRGLDYLSDDQRRELVVAHARHWDGAASVIVSPKDDTD